VFADWCNRLPAVRLGEVRRFAEPWEADASLALRLGDTRAAGLYASHGRLHTSHPAVAADTVARRFAGLDDAGKSVAITTASAAMARQVNLAIQALRRSRRRGRSVTLRDGAEVWEGDRVATRRNDASLVPEDGTSVRNRQTWTVRRVGLDGSLVVTDPERGSVVLPAEYVAKHVELGWAVTGYGNQGVTTDEGICVVEPATSRAGLYVGMTRGRLTNTAVVLDDTGTADPAEQVSSIILRPLGADSALATRDRLHGRDLTRGPEIQRALQELPGVGRTPAPERGLSLA
jgi:hypothetical protein